MKKTPVIFEVATELALTQERLASAAQKFGPLKARACAMATSVGGIGPLMKDRLMGQADQHLDVTGVSLLYESVWMQFLDGSGKILLRKQTVGSELRKILQPTSLDFDCPLFNKESVHVKVWKMPLGGAVGYFLSCPGITDVVYPGGIFNAGFIQTWSTATQTLDANDICAAEGIEDDAECQATKAIVSGVRPVDDNEDYALLEAAVAEHSDNMDVFDTCMKAPYIDSVVADTTYLNISPATYLDRLGPDATPYLVQASWFDAVTANVVPKDTAAQPHVAAIPSFANRAVKAPIPKDNIGININTLPMEVAIDPNIQMIGPRAAARPAAAMMWILVRARAKASLTSVI